MRVKGILSIVLVLAISVGVCHGDTDSVAIEKRTINGKTVNVVTIDYNNPILRFDVVKGNDRLEGWEDFKSIINRTKPLAAINGNFFNAYATEEKDIVPWGYIIQRGKVLNYGNNLGAFAVARDRKLIVNNSKAFSIENVETMIEAGPLLLLNGVVVFDPNSSEFAEAKINSNAAQRSAIGITAEGKVLLVTGPNLKVSELALVMKALGCTAATNLDGGASSALYAKGTYVTNAGRKLNTVLVLYQDAVPVAPAIRVMVNGEKLNTEVAPLVSNGRTLVPLRGILEALGARIQWDSATRTVTAEKDGNTLKLTIGSKIAYLNGTPMEIDAAAVIADGRALVPARFVAEAFGAEVKWDPDSRTISIED